MNGIGLASRTYVAVLTVFLLAPVMIVAAVALTPANFITFPPPSLSLRWFEKVLSDPEFLWPLWNSFRLGVVSTSLATLLAVPAALWLVRHPGHLASELQTFLLSPLSLPSIILATGLLFFTARIGLGNSFLALTVGHCVIIIPYIMRTVFGVYAGVNREIELAALVHGAGPFQAFWYVTLPMIRSGIVAGAIFAFLLSFDEVPVALLLTDTDTTTLPVSILSYLVYNYDPAVAAISTIQIVVVIAILLILERFVGINKIVFVAR